MSSLLTTPCGATWQDAATLEAHLSPLIDETPDLGWEERTDAAITHLLKTALAKVTAACMHAPPPSHRPCPSLLTTP